MEFYKNGKKTVMCTMLAFYKEMVSRRKNSGTVTGREDYGILFSPLCLYIL